MDTSAKELTEAINKVNIMINSFEKNCVNYSPAQSVNGGVQWKAHYSDGQYALLVFYGRVTRKIIVDGFYWFDYKEEGK